MSASTIRSRIALLSARAAPLASAIAGALSVTTSTAWAQQSGLDEIVVTARYREENVQTTPISISAFSGEDLEIRSIENVEDIGLVVPNAYFRRNTSNFGPNNTIGLRGLNQVDFSYAFEPTVGIYIDDVYHSTITGSDMDLIDLERVEVLRGPQGTLFGKNSIGGAIRLISKAPQGDDTGMVSVTLGDYDRLDLKAIGDFALVEDKFFVRLVGVAKQQDGYGASLDFTCEMVRRGTPQLAGLGDGLGFGGYGPDSTGTTGDFDTLPDLLPPVAVPVGGPDDNAFSLPAARSIAQDGTCELGTLGGTSSEAGRVMLRFVPSDRLDINLAFDLGNSDDDPNVDTQLSPINNGTDNAYDSNVVFRRYGIHYNDARMLTGDVYTNYATFADPVNGQYYPRNSVMDSGGLSLVIDYDLTDRMGVKLILADRGYDSEWTNDSDRTPFGITQTHYIQNHDEQQAEVQLSGALGEQGRLGWTGGVFFFESESRAYNTTEFEAFNYTGALLNFVGLVETEEISEESWTAKFPWERLKADFAGWHENIQTVIDRTDRDSCFRWSLYYRPPITTWSTRRATLLGDAVHATLPYLAQGAAMAIEDAAVLTRALQATGSVADALPQYERNRIDRTSRIVKGSDANRTLFHMRDQKKLRREFAVRDEGADRNAWLYSYNPLTVTLT